MAAWAEPRWFTAWLNGFAGAPLGADGRPALDTPQMLAALNLLKELRPAGPPPPSTYDEGVRLFRQGRAAFAIDGDWSLAGYREYTDTLDIGVAALPLVPATQRVAAPAFGGMYLMYSAQLGGARLDQARAGGQFALDLAPAERADDHARPKLVEQRAVLANLIFHIKDAAISDMVGVVGEEDWREILRHLLCVLGDLHQPMRVGAGCNRFGLHGLHGVSLSLRGNPGGLAGIRFRQSCYEFLEQPNTKRLRELFLTGWPRLFRTI